jgi:uncharacterized membrane protein YozB (DUF420 family)
VQQLADILPHINATLNALATVLLLAGYVLIKQRREAAHKWTMIACFGVSCVFLACYVTAHELKRRLTGMPHTEFSTELYGAAAAYTYKSILLSHIVLAITVPFLAITTIYAGLKAGDLKSGDAAWRQFHRKIAWVAFPVWLYVSVTGVVVYAMLYHLYPPR